MGDSAVDKAMQYLPLRSQQTPGVNRAPYPADSFSIRYNYYDGNKHGGDYLYPITKDIGQLEALQPQQSDSH